VRLVIASSFLPQHQRQEQTAQCDPLHRQSRRLSFLVSEAADRPGIVKLTSKGRNVPHATGTSEAGREARHLGPDLKGLGPGLAMSGGVGVSGATEEVSNLIVNREKALGLPG
jgi:hypothetical protein